MRFWLSAALALVPAARLPAQCPDGTPPPCGAPAPAHSVAVLTFDNITRDTTAQYLAEGLADQIFTRLAQIERLTVISRSAVRRVRNADQLSVQQLGRLLNAAYLVNGSIRVAGGRVHVNVEALRAATGAAVWSTALDRAADELLGIEEAIASEVAAGITTRLTPAERRVLVASVTRDPVAYAAYLRGNYYLARRTPESLRRAIVEYGAAVHADTGLVDAHARLALALGLCTAYLGCGADSALALGRREADAAIALDARSSQAWLGRGVVLFYDTYAGTFVRDTLSAAFAALHRAVELDPRNAEAWHHYGADLTGVNDSLSEAGLRRALTLDPARAISFADLATLYGTMGRTADAIRMADSAIALDSNALYLEIRMVARLELGDTAGALADARLTRSYATSAALLAAIAGDTTARAHVAAGPGDQISTVRFLVWSGQRDMAVDSAIPLLAQNAWRLGHDFRRPMWAALRNDPRFRAAADRARRELGRVSWQ